MQLLAIYFASKGVLEIFFAVIVGKKIDSERRCDKDTNGNSTCY